jgi:hypothetical protein
MFIRSDYAGIHTGLGRFYAVCRVYDDIAAFLEGYWDKKESLVD